MPLREDILKPISEGNPCGPNLYYSPLYDTIKEALRQDETGPQGDWERALKTADYPQVRQLTETAIATQTKDLQLATWLAEALIYEKQVEGLCDGLQFMAGLIAGFWDGLYPELEEGDAAYRYKHLERLGNYFDPSKGSSPALAVRRLYLTKSKVDWFKYKESLRVPSDAEAKESETKKAARDAALNDGKLSPEHFQAAFRETPKAFYRDLESGLKMAAELLTALDGVCQEKFTKPAPGFGALCAAIEEVQNSVRILLLEKLKQDPDPLPVSVDTGTDPVPEIVSEVALPLSDEVAGAAPISSTSLSTRDDAIRLLVASAQFLRRSSPADPVSYLTLRALRWGELRMGNRETMGPLLDAPSAEVRRQLKNAALAADWTKVLEIAETAAATACGRGWLDLHRYTIQACDKKSYPVVAQALRTHLKGLLADFPTLPQMTLVDDTGTANPETLSWLIREGLFHPAEENSAG